MPYVIYVLRNKTNNKIYVGQTENFKVRMRRHAKVATYGNLRHLYCAIRKYGWDNFESLIIEEEIDEENIDDSEEFWIQYFRSWDRDIGYNLTLGGEGCVPTEGTREKMRQAKLGKLNPKMQGANHPLYGIKGENHHRYGTHHTDEVKAKIAAANIGRDFAKGSDQGNSKLTEENVLYMRKYFTEHLSDKTKDVLSYLAKKFDVEEGTVESIVYNMSWKHVAMYEHVNKNQKLKTEDVIDIRHEMVSALKKVTKRKELADKYGVSSHTIYEIETRRKRNDVK